MRKYTSTSNKGIQKVTSRDVTSRDVTYSAGFSSFRFLKNCQRENVTFKRGWIWGLGLRNGFLTNFGGRQKNNQTYALVATSWAKSCRQNRFWENPKIPEPESEVTSQEESCWISLKATYRSHGPGGSQSTPPNCRNIDPEMQESTTSTSEGSKRLSPEMWPIALGFSSFQLKANTKTWPNLGVLAPETASWQNLGPAKKKQK